jgi:peroxiredoxin
MALYLVALLTNAATARTVQQAVDYDPGGAIRRHPLGALPGGRDAHPWPDQSRRPGHRAKAEAHDAPAWARERIGGRRSIAPPVTGNERSPARSPSLLAAGAEAPPFALSDAPYSRLALDDLRGRDVVVVFYVADWHPVATAQLARYQELVPEIGRRGAAVVGISSDSTWSHESFARALGLTFPLLADDSPPGAVARLYGVHVPETGRSRRALFVIDVDGIVSWSAVFPDALDPGLDGVLSALERLGAERAGASIGDGGPSADHVG